MVARCRRHRTNAAQRQAFRAYRTLKGPSALLRPLGNSSPCLIRQRLWSRIIAGGRRSQLGRRAIARPELCPPDRSDELAASGRARPRVNDGLPANRRSLRGGRILSEGCCRKEDQSDQNGSHGGAPFLDDGCRSRNNYRLFQQRSRFL
jgi:hypothetical protein